MGDLTGYEDVIPFMVMHHHLWANEGRFVTKDEDFLPPCCIPDPFSGATHVFKLYLQADSDYEGWFTARIFWDAKQSIVVNNESSQLVVVFNNFYNNYANRPNVYLHN